MFGDLDWPLARRAVCHR